MGLGSMQSAADAATDPAARLTHRIVQARPDAPGTAVYVEFDDGLAGRIDLAPIVAPGLVTAPLADGRFLAQVGIGARGRSLEWPGELELCADALRMKLASAQFGGEK